MTSREQIERLQGECTLLFKLGKWERAKRVKAKLDALMDEQLKAENLAETIRRDIELIVTTDRAA